MATSAPARHSARRVEDGGGRPMTVADMSRLWRIAHKVDGRAGLRGLRARLAFMAAAVRHRRVLLPILHASGALGRVMARRPETIGCVVWPYVCQSWDAATRLERIREHWSVVEQIAPALNFPPDAERELLDLADLMPGLRVVLDQPKWFLREGQAVLNLFMGETRVLSLAFTLRSEDVLTAYIGALQGRNIDGALEIYKALTGALHGMRPRDFLIDLFRALCVTIGVERVCAVSDASRQHRSPYFGLKAETLVSVDYDSIWQDRGATLLDTDFYLLTAAVQRRSIEDVASKKRSMYRKRYAMLEQVESQLRDALMKMEAQDGVSTAH